MVDNEVLLTDNHSRKRTFGRTAMHKTFNLGWVSTDLGSTPRACIINLWEGSQMGFGGRLIIYGGNLVTFQGSIPCSPIMIGFIAQE